MLNQARLELRAEQEAMERLEKSRGPSATMVEAMSHAVPHPELEKTQTKVPSAQPSSSPHQLLDAIEWCRMTDDVWALERDETMSRALAEDDEAVVRDQIEYDRMYHL